MKKKTEYCIMWRNPWNDYQWNRVKSSTQNKVLKDLKECKDIEPHINFGAFKVVTTQLG